MVKSSSGIAYYTSFAMEVAVSVMFDQFELMLISLCESGTTRPHLEIRSRKQREQGYTAWPKG